MRGLTGSRVVRAILALPFLQLLLAGFRAVAIPHYPAWQIFVPMGELVLLVAILARYGRRRSARWIVSFGIAALLVFNGGDIFYRSVFMTRFRPFSDVALLPGFTRMFFPGAPVSDLILGLAAGLLIAAVATLGGRLIVILANNLVPREWWKQVTVAGILLIVVLPAQSPLVTVTSQIMETRALPERPDGTDESAQEAAPPSTVEPEPAAVDAVIPDLHIIVVESYGSTLLETDTYRDFLIPLYGRLNDRIISAEYCVYSAFLRSPTFGGRSWLADGSILTGTYITDQGLYDRIVKAGEPARLLDELADHDYYRIYAAPGTRDAPDQWRRAYPFDRYLLRYDFGYEGPFINLGAMSDQFLLNEIADRHLDPDRHEFVFALLVSSHVPFEVIPRYRPSWEFPLRGKEYEMGDLQYFDNNWLSGGELAEGYLAGIEHALTSSVGYVTRKTEGPNIFIVLGDHQPRKPVSHSVAGYAVPVHVIVPGNFHPDSIPDFVNRWSLTPGFEPVFPVPGRPLWESEDQLPGLDAVSRMVEELLFSDQNHGMQ